MKHSRGRVLDVTSLTDLDRRLAAGATSLAGWRAVAAKGKVFPAPSKDWCDAKCFAVQIVHGQNHASGAIVLPLVEGYPEDQIEIVAADNLRTYFALDDGDLITLQILS